ncbi:MAG: DUF971 domain-containing protein [Acidimicrobiia bacterium]
MANSNVPPDPTPSRVDIDRTAHLQVEWPDGRTVTLPLALVRANCPCAECRGAREQGRTPGTAANPEIVDADFVGAWGLGLAWNDGHTTGIYSWELLRAWSDVDESGDPSLPG